jgi:ATP-dependent DNA helicase RecG
MDDILLLTDRIRNTLILGESHFREFKSAFEGRPENKKPRITKAICGDIGEALVAFANADGGAIIIGVEDDGIVTGIPHSVDDIEKMLDATRTHVFSNQLLPIIQAVKIVFEGKTILYFSVNKGTTQVYQLPDGRCVIRKDKATIPGSFEQIQFERKEIISREYDSQFIDGALVTHLDLNLLQGIADQFLKGISVERYLQQIGLAEYGLNGLRLKRAALLLFAKDIDKWHPRCQVRFLKVNGITFESGEKFNVISDEIVKGNIFEIITKSFEQFRNYFTVKTELLKSGDFLTHYFYPELAVREAILNAIAHRDYNISNAIEIYIFDDRLEIKSPGTLLSTITLKDLYSLDGTHESRNSLISRVLKENNYMRELGEGMKRIFGLMAEENFKRPELYSNGHWFRVTLFNLKINTTVA